jgi:FkbM family methyltransferase
VLRGAPRVVSGARKFAVRELMTGGVGTYRLRGSGVRIVLRHRTSDVFAFHEVFNQRVYDDLFGGSAQARVRPLRVLDLGAHIGLFCARAAATLPHAHITAVEPDRGNQAILHQTAALNRSHGEWDVVEACAHIWSGNVQFIEDGSWVSRVAGVGEPPVGLESSHQTNPSTVAAVDAFDLMDGADIVKMDIEGSEWPILSDPRFRQVRVGRLLIEYHPWACPEEDSTRMITSLMKQAEFEALPMEEWSPERAVVLAGKGEPDGS